VRPPSSLRFPPRQFSNELLVSLVCKLCTLLATLRLQPFAVRHFHAVIRLLHRCCVTKVAAAPTLPLTITGTTQIVTSPSSAAAASGVARRSILPVVELQYSTDLHPETLAQSGAVGSVQPCPAYVRGHLAMWLLQILRQRMSEPVKPNSASPEHLAFGTSSSHTSATLPLAVFDCNGIDSALTLNATLDKWPGPKAYAVLMWYGVC
jgi:hypothetical protein